MICEKGKANKLTLTDLDRLDPVTVIYEDYEPGKGKMIIECYGTAWSAYWGGMGDNSIAEFFISCDEHYIAKNLSDIDSTIYDEDKIHADASDKGVLVHRDDPWNDYAFMQEMYGNDPVDWYDAVPKKPNPKYKYLCRIIKAVQEGFKSL